MRFAAEERVGVRHVQPEIFRDTQLGDLLADLLCIRFGQLRAAHQTPVVVVDAFAQLRQFRKEPTFLERRHHVVDQRRHSTATRDEPLADHVDVVDVDVRQVGHERIRRIGSSHRPTIGP